jgi:hypothetical protein
LLALVYFAESRMPEVTFVTNGGTDKMPKHIENRHDMTVQSVLSQDNCLSVRVEMLGEIHYPYPT